MVLKDTLQQQYADGNCLTVKQKLKRLSSQGRLGRLENMSDFLTFAQVTTVGRLGSGHRPDAATCSILVSSLGPAEPAV